MRTFKEMLLIAAKGMAAGLGGVAPGLSGSVLLVMFGLYERLIEAISGIFKSFKKNALFLLPLGIGMLLGVIGFSNGVKFLLENFEMPTRYAFFGLILGSVPLVFKEVKKHGFKKIYYIHIAVAFIIGAALMLNRAALPAVGDPNFLQSILLGIVVSAAYMIPGVDSAAILSAFGMYELWTDVLASPFDNIVILLEAAIGIGVGVLVFSILINKLLKRFYTATFSIIFGFFLSVVPSVLNGSCVPSLSVETAASFLFFALGLTASLLFSRLSLKAKKKED